LLTVVKLLPKLDALLLILNKFIVVVDEFSSSEATTTEGLDNIVDLVLVGYDSVNAVLVFVHQVQGFKRARHQDVCDTFYLSTLKVGLKFVLEEFAHEISPLDGRHG